MDIVKIISDVIPFVVGGAVCIAAVFGMVILRRAIRRYVASRLIYSRRFSDDGAYEGDEVTLTQTIWNPTVFPLFFIDAQWYIYGGLSIDGNATADAGKMQYCVSRFNLLPFARVERRHTVKCVRRGCYRLETVEMDYGQTPRIISSQSLIYVYPPLTDAVDDMPISDMLGDAVSRRMLISNPFSLCGVREYRPGDGFNTINFKATARSFSGGNNVFMVNKTDYSSNRDYMIYQNFHVAPGLQIDLEHYEMLMDKGLSVAATLVRSASDSGGNTGFCANCTTSDGALSITFPPQSGKMHYIDILRGMATLRAGDGASFAGLIDNEVARGVENSEVFIITVGTDDVISQKVELLRRFGNAVSVIDLSEAVR
ncbi:MAG: DUF58 domain-containing protein [Clostridia bacterium]|nr:DUF58 domain-containing protein [Clostridia bacterium]